MPLSQDPPPGPGSSHDADVKRRPMTKFDLLGRTCCDHCKKPIAYLRTYFEMRMEVRRRISIFPPRYEQGHSVQRDGLSRLRRLGFDLPSRYTYAFVCENCLPFFREMGFAPWAELYLPHSSHIQPSPRRSLPFTHDRTDRR